MPAKIIHEPNLARSAIAPEISATVMIAKVAPYAETTSPSLEVPARPKSLNGLPARNWFSPSAMTVMLDPYRIQSTPTRPMAPKLIIIMLTTLLALTRPP